MDVDVARALASNAEVAKDEKRDLGRTQMMGWGIRVTVENCNSGES